MLHPDHVRFELIKELSGSLLQGRNINEMPEPHLLAEYCCLCANELMTRMGYSINHAPTPSQDAQQAKESV